MKKLCRLLSVLALMLGLSSIAWGQFGQITYGTVPPVGSCGGSPQLAFDQTSSILYQCGQDGVWRKSISNPHSSSVVLPCIAASNSSSAYSCSTSTAFIPLFGDAILFKADVANSGPATLNVNSSAAAPIRKNGPITALAGGELIAGQSIVLMYDGTNWQLLQQPSQTILTNGTTIPPGTAQAQSPVTIAGITSASVCYVSFSSPPPASWLTGIDILPVVVSNNTATVLLSNATTQLITPGGIQLNVKCIP